MSSIPGSSRKEYQIFRNAKISVGTINKNTKESDMYTRKILYDRLCDSEMFVARKEKVILVHQAQLGIGNLISAHQTVKLAIFD